MSATGETYFSTGVIRPLLDTRGAALFYDPNGGAFKACRAIGATQVDFPGLYPTVTINGRSEFGRESVTRAFLQPKGATP